MNPLSKRLVSGLHCTSAAYISGSQLYTDFPLQGEPTAIYKTNLQGVDCTIFIRPLPGWRVNKNRPWKQESCSIRNTPVLNHALRTGKLIFGKRPTRSMKLEVFVMWNDLGEVFEGVSNHSDYGDDWHDLADERIRDACSRDSFVAFGFDRSYFFRDIADAAWFTIKWS